MDAQKANAMITLPPEIVQKTREPGLNALKEYIRRLEGPFHQNSKHKGGIGTAGSNFGSPG